MAHRGDNLTPGKLTIEELRRYPGNENLSDEQLEVQSNSLLEVSIILFKLYQQMDLGFDLNQDFELFDQPDIEVQQHELQSK